MPISPRRRLLEYLSDGVCHSTQALSAALGLPDSEIQALIDSLYQQGITIDRAEAGYWLNRDPDWLDAEMISAMLSPVTRSRLAGLVIHDQIDSTNGWLLAQADTAGPMVCLAEQQTAGRGRRGRPWASPYAAHLYLSLSWWFDDIRQLPAGLSLMTGIVIAETLQALGIPGVAIKWPNDLFWQDRKLGGILIETGQRPDRRCQTVIGLGLNVAMPPVIAQGIDQAWTDLRQISGDRIPSRNRLAAVLVDNLATLLTDWQQSGRFEAFQRRWQRYDALAGRVVTITLPNDTATGIACGIDDQGALQLRTDTGLQRFIVGEASLRLNR